MKIKAIIAIFGMLLLMSFSAVANEGRHRRDSVV